MPADPVERDEEARTRALARALSDALAIPSPPELAVVLGSGLGGTAEALGDRRTVAAGDLPHFPLPTVAGHQCDIHAGRLGPARVLVVTGRVHLYEGHSRDVVTRPVRAFAALGIPAVILANTAGSTRAALPPGAILMSRQVFHWMGARVRLPDGSRDDAREAESTRGEAARRMARIASSEAAMESGARAAAAAHAIALRSGVLAAGLGPNYETAAEVNMLRRLGADALTMSTVPEFAAARASGLAAVVFTVITNHATGVVPGAHLTHREVTERGARAARELAVLIAAVASALAGPVIRT